MISHVAVEPGQGVRSGDVLIRLDSREAEAQLEVAEGDLRLAEARRDHALAGSHRHAIEAARHTVELQRERWRHAQQEHDRVSRLAERGAASVTERHEAETAMLQARAALAVAESELKALREAVRDVDEKVSRAEVEAARTSLDHARVQMEQASLTAPIDGTVLEVLKWPGEATGAFGYDPVLLLADTSNLRVTAEVDERFAHLIRVGQRAVVTGRNLGMREYLGRVSAIHGVMGPKTLFADVPQDRKDLDVVRVLIELAEPLQAPLGLRTDVRIDVRNPE